MNISLKDFQKTPSIRLMNRDTRVYMPRQEVAKFNPEKTEYIVAAAHNDFGEASYKTEAGGLVVATPGEYEFKEVFVSALVNDEETAEEHRMEMVEVEMDSVRVLYYFSDTAVNKAKLDHLGIIDVLVLDLPEDVKMAQKIVNVIDPQVVAPLSANKQLLEKFKSELGVKFETSDKQTYKKSDFSSDDYVLSGLELTA